MNEGYRVGIFGTSGSGKSYYFVKKVLPELIRRGEKVFLFDGDNGVNEKDIKVPYKEFTGITDLFGYLSKRGKIETGLYLIRVNSPGDLLHGIKFLNLMDSDSVCVIEELPFALAGSDQRLRKKVMDQIFKIARAGRKRGRSLILISQRPVDLEADIRAVISTVICFRLTLENDIQALERMVPEKISGIVDLKRGKYKIYGTKLFFT